jgi:hypothetical protein
MPVHLDGHLADMYPINAIAQRHNLKIIEDNAQAIGTKYKDRETGGLGDLGCISFFPSKNLGGYGEGRMIVTNCETYSTHLRVLRNHGSPKKYYASEQGWNSRLDEIQAAILRVKSIWVNSFRFDSEIFTPKTLNQAGTFLAPQFEWTTESAIASVYAPNFPEWQFHTSRHRRQVLAHH